ncbi:MAG: tetratricopeptide repeat protein [Myxococcales bacterium]|nr:tetratricopeptide repeat protein [Myxococcales bacterium]
MPDSARDLRTDNVLLGEDARARVVDFGLASRSEGAASDSGGSLEGLVSGPDLEASASSGSGASANLFDAPLTDANTLLGTPAYMSPEQHRCERVGPPSDQFSFCVALYEALYRARPFSGRNRKELALKIISGRLNDPPEGARVPAWIRRIVLRGLAARPEQRWPSMAALLSALERDPSRTRRRWLALGLSAAVVAGSLYGVARYSGARARQCEGAEAKLHGAWDDARRGQLAAAFAGNEASYARDVQRSVERTLDAYARDWATVHTEACVATLRGEQSPELLDLRVACLERRRSALTSLVDVLVTADAKVVERAAQAASSLPRIDRCSDVEALISAVPPPDDPQAAAAVAGIRAQLDRSHALENAARFAEATALLDGLTADVERLDYGPLTAEFKLRRAQLLSFTGTFDQAAETFEGALWTAIASGDEATAASAASELVFLCGLQLGDRALAGVWYRLGDAILQRIDPEGQTAAALVGNWGSVAHVAGDVEVAEEALQRSLDLMVRIVGPDHLLVAARINNLGVFHESRHDYARAFELYSRAVAIWEREVGPEHPEIALSFDNIGSLMTREGRFEEAIGYHERALRLRARALGDDHPSVARIHNNLATSALALRRYDAALEHATRALALFERHYGAKHLLTGVGLFNVGQVYFERGELALARQYYADARTRLQAAVGPEHAYTAYAIAGFGELALAEGRPGEARARLEEALAVLGDVIGPEEQARYDFALGRALWLEGEDRERARVLLAAAEEAFAKIGNGFGRMRAEVATWRAEHVDVAEGGAAAAQ